MIFNFQLPFSSESFRSRSLSAFRGNFSKPAASARVSDWKAAETSSFIPHSSRIRKCFTVNFPKKRRFSFAFPAFFKHKKGKQNQPADGKEIHRIHSQAAILGHCWQARFAYSGKVYFFRKIRNLSFVFRISSRKTVENFPTARFSLLICLRRGERSNGTVRITPGSSRKLNGISYYGASVFFVRMCAYPLGFYGKSAKIKSVCLYKGFEREK